MTEKRRCTWAGTDPLYVAYHDDEWGIPEHDEVRLFEMLILEGAQAGLSWLTILKKRENYRRAFAGFDPARVARFDRRKIESLLGDEGIVRNRLKVNAAVTNAQAYLKIQDEFDGFDPFIWGFVGGKPRANAWRTMKQVPVTTPESDAMSRELKRRGMKFVGSTICYALMQAIGMVNDHTTDCAWHDRAGRRRRRSR
jgi:DNA-3-methyladenine glycosylase I